MLRFIFPMFFVIGRKHYGYMFGCFVTEKIKSEVALRHLRLKTLIGFESNSVPFYSVAS